MAMAKGPSGPHFLSGSPWLREGGVPRRSRFQMNAGRWGMGCQVLRSSSLGEDFSPGWPGGTVRRPPVGLPGGWGGGCCSPCSAHIDAWQPDTHPSHRGIPLPSLGTLGPGLMTPSPTRRGSNGRKGRRGPSPSSVSASVPRFCRTRTSRSRLGWGREGGAGVGREEARVGTRPPAGRRAGGLLTFARAWARQFAPRSQMTKYTTRRKGVTRGGAATRRVLLNRRPAWWSKTLGLSQARGR